MNWHFEPKKGWMNSWKQPFNNSAVSAGSLSIPRELRLENGLLYSYPAREALALLVSGESDLFARGVAASYGQKAGSKIEVLYGTDSAEIFINGGGQVITLRYDERLRTELFDFRALKNT